jgi:hypothetical protein
LATLRRQAGERDSELERVSDWRAYPESDLDEATKESRKFNYRSKQVEE